MEQKRVLLIAGAGTLGGYTGLELLNMGFHVDCIALEDLVSYNKNYTYIRASVTNELLEDLFSKHHYDCIVDFIHYPDPEFYRNERMKLLLDNTDQLIFLSSYRVYADEQHPVTESAPQLLYTNRDEYFLANEDYAIPKSHNENSLRASGYKNWTIIRPLISFSHFRFDLITQGAASLILRAHDNKKTLLPACCKNRAAGVLWAGNSGKLIAHLCCNEKALGEDFTIGTGEAHTWGEVADYYTELTGMEFEWVDIDTYLENATANHYMNRCILMYDRVYDRDVDCSKVLAATGLTADDFLTVKEGIAYELNYIMDRPDLVARFNTEEAKMVNEKMDRYFEGKK